MSEVDLSDLARAHGGSQRLNGYLAFPTGTGPWPGVVMLHEIFGLNDVMRRHADRLAALGYLTLAVDLFSTGVRARCLVSAMVAMVRGQGRAFADIAAARELLVTGANCTGRVGVIGFCLGGSFALLSARQGYEAAAINYGQLPRHIDAKLGGTCPIVGSYGRRDLSLRGAATRLEEALSRAAVPHDVREYPAAGHAFLNDIDPAPRFLWPLLQSVGIGPEPDSAQDAWNRIEKFFDTHLR